MFFGGFFLSFAEKDIAMKASSLIILLLFAGCSLLDPELPMGSPRANERNNRNGSTDGSGQSVLGRKDTTFYVSAVTFPAAYDWQRDTAFGNVACTLKVFKGAVPVLTMPAGPSHKVSASPHRNHLLGSSIFTEYSDLTGTWVKQDGRPIANWPETEQLQGLLSKKGVLYTLGIGVKSQGFTYRRDGQVIMKIEKGQLFGSFAKDTYGPTGALYEDRGTVCFAYQTVLDGMSSVYIVRDGVSELLSSSPSAEYMDVRQIDGVVAQAYNDGGVSMLKYGNNFIDIKGSKSAGWSNAGFLMFNGSPSVAGIYKSKSGSGFGIGSAGSLREIGNKVDYFYTDGSRFKFIDLTDPEWNYSFFFNRHCACIVGGDLAYVLTPRDPTLDPYLCYRGQKQRFSMHGFLAGVSVVTEE